MKKLLYVCIAIIIIIGVYLGLENVQKQNGTNIAQNRQTVTENASTTEQEKDIRSIGGDKDSHGCVLGGGYSWDNEVNACVRPWEKLSVLVPSKKWYLVNSDGSISNTIYFQTNADGTKVSGKVCNSFSGSIKIDNKSSTVYFSNITSTLMACADKSITAIESKLFGVANGIITVTLNANTGHIVLSNPIIPIKVEFAPKDK